MPVGDLRHDKEPDDDQAPLQARRTYGRRIEGAVDEIFSRAEDAVRDVADQATHLAEDTLERGRAGVRRAERSSRGGHPGWGGRGGTSPFATALAVGAMGYAIATLIHGAMGKRHTAPGKPAPSMLPAA